MRHTRLQKGRTFLGIPASLGSTSRILSMTAVAPKRAKTFLMHRRLGRGPLATIKIPADLDTVLNKAWEETRKVPGHLGENEARFLGLLAACVPAKGAIVEIGSFKARSTVMLANVSSRYGFGSEAACHISEYGHRSP